MSRQSAPTPIYRLNRAEDLSNLNQILLELMTDDRMRIRASDEVLLSKNAGQRYVETSVTHDLNYTPVVIAAVRVNSDWYPIPYINTGPTTAAPVLQEQIRLKISYSGGIATLTFSQHVNDTDLNNATIRKIKYYILRDKQE